MDTKRLLELAGIVEAHAGTRSLDEMNKLSNKYMFYLEEDPEGGLRVAVYTKNKKAVGFFGDLDAMVDTGLEH